MEKQAREISSVLRCLVCQNESIDESSASLARDLRILVRERLLLGETNDQVLEFIVSRQVSTLNHVMLGHAYWLFHALDVNLGNEASSLSRPLNTPMARWPLVREITDAMIAAEEALLQPNNKWSTSSLFMSSWVHVRKKLNKILFTSSLVPTSFALN